MSDSYEIRNLETFDDLAPQFGLGDRAEARFASGQVNLAEAGFSFHRLRPDCRHAFGHRHEQAEEIYLVLSGSGRIKLDDEIRDIARYDVVRVDPQVIRAFEAGPEGLEYLVFGAHHEGDGELLHGWWED